jgi:D-lactate dehydrogenase (cytochrome)
MTIVLGDGRVLRVGRPVVKNVAGYDLAKLMVGAQGTLGLIADVTLKFTAIPRRRCSLMYPLDSLEKGWDWGQRCLSLARVASAIVISTGIPVLPSNSHQSAPYWLTYTAEGLPEDVDAELDLVSQALQRAGAPDPQWVEGFSGTDLWKGFLGSPQTGELRVRSAVAPKDLANFVMAQQPDLQQTSYLVDLASGFVYAVSDSQEPAGPIAASMERMRQAALALGGYQVVLGPANSQSIGPDLWGYRPETLNLMINLKASWDPANILNPGCFLQELG